MCVSPEQTGGVRDALTWLAVLRSSAPCCPSPRLDVRRLSLVLMAGWLLARGGLRMTGGGGGGGGEPPGRPGSDPGPWRRRCRRPGGGAGGSEGSPSDDGVSAGPLSVSDSTGGRLLGAAASAAAVAASPLPSSCTPFSTTGTRNSRHTKKVSHFKSDESLELH